MGLSIRGQMKEESINTLVDAFFEFLGALFVNLVLYTLLFYAIYKTVTSFDNEQDVHMWLKYWTFYGLFSFITIYLEHGTLIKAIACGILLLKFNDNVILHASYDIILANVLKYSNGYFRVILSDVMYVLYRVVECIHWTVISTCNISDESATESVKVYEQVRGVIMKRTKQTWKDMGTDLSIRLSRNASKNHVHPTEHAVSEDHDALYDRINRSCIIAPEFNEDDSFPVGRFSSTEMELRRRR